MRHSMVVFMVLTGSMVWVSTATLADEQMKSGLWETSIKMGIEIEMTPEQREMMKTMGIKIPGLAEPIVQVKKMCLTKENAALVTNPMENVECQSKNFNQSGGIFSGTIVCNGPDMKGEVTTKGNYMSESFTVAYDFKGASQGTPTIMHSETIGKWLGADCGDVKP